MREIITEKIIKENLNTRKEKGKENGQDRIREQREKDETKKEAGIKSREAEFMKLMALVKVEKGGKIFCQREDCENKINGISFVEDSAYGVYCGARFVAQ